MRRTFYSCFKRWKPLRPFLSLPLAPDLFRLLLPLFRLASNSGGGGGDERVELRGDGSQADQRHPLVRRQLHQPPRAQPHHRVMLLSESPLKHFL